MVVSLSKRLAILAMLCFTAPSLMAQPHGSGAPVILGTQTYSVKSETTSRTYQIFVSKPVTPAPEGGYPVIYLTDANGYFGTMVETVRTFVRSQRGKGEAVVVGIGYPWKQAANISRLRAFDLTTKLGGAGTPEGFGGATGFLRFILDELKPQIESKFTINKNRQTLFGHSFGGLFALHALINEPSAFQTYLLASPSTWWGERHSFRGNFFGRLTPKLESTGATARVLVTIGDLEQPKVKQPFKPRPGQPILPGVEDRTPVDDILKLTDKLKNTPGIHAESIVFEGETHGSVVPAAISRGVTFALHPDAEQPMPAEKRTFKDTGAPTPVPAAADYVKLSAEERYDLRMKLRAWPKDIADPWIKEFKYKMDAHLWYDDHYGLHAEKVAMDEKHGTTPAAH